MVARLLVVRWVSFRNSLTRGDKRDRRRALSGVLLSGIMIWMVYGTGLQFFAPLADVARTDPAMQVVLAGLPSAGLFAAFWMLLLSALTVGIQTFYLNPELPLLLSAPLRPRAVFAAKFVEATLANTALFLVVSAPLLLAYSLARGTITPPYLLYLLLALAAFCAIPSAIGSAAVMVLMRVLPANRTRDILAALGVALFAGLYVVLSLAVRSTGDAETFHRTTQALSAMVSNPWLHVGPWAWAGQAVSGGGAASDVWSALALLWGCAAVLLWSTGAVASGMHLRGWSSAQEVATQAGTVVRTSSADWEGRLRLLPPPVRGVFLKDMRSLWRDMRQLSLFFIPIAVVVVFLFQVRSMAEIERLPSAILAQMLYPVLAMISMRLAMSAFMTEGRALWLLLSSPTDPRAFLVGKFGYAYSLSMAISVVTTAIFGVLRGVAGWDWLTNFALMGCAVAGFCGIGVGSGVLLCDFQAENARFIMSPGGRLMTFFLQMGYLVVLTVSTLASWYLAKSHVAPPALIYAGAGLVVLAATLGAIALPMWLGARRLRSMEW